MITKEQINEIRKLLEKSRNPLFLFDDDPDGICSYLLLKKFYKKGEGIPIKSSPNLNESYVPIIEKKNPDLIVVLDKALIDQEFIDRAKRKIIWLDHHPLIERKNVYYYNPRMNDSLDNRPTTYLAYSIVEENMWVAMLGCVFDYYMPDFTKQFVEKYNNLMDKVTDDPGEARFNTNFGKLIKIFSFNLKGKSYEVSKAIQMLEKVNDPYDLVEGKTEAGRFLINRYEKLEKEYNLLLKKSEKIIAYDKFFVFIYPYENTSFTSDLSNELSYKHQDKIVIVGREKSDRIIMSIRSRDKKILKPLEKTLKNFEGHGGGHDYACGASVNTVDFDRFITEFKKNLN